MKHLRAFYYEKQNWLNSRTWVLAIIILVCSSSFIACVPLLSNRKSPLSTVQDRGVQKELIKPKLEENQPLGVSVAAETKTRDNGISSAKKQSGLSFDPWKSIFSQFTRTSSGEQTGSKSKLIKPRLQEIFPEVEASENRQDEGKSRPQEAAIDRKGHGPDSLVRGLSSGEKSPMTIGRPMTDRRASRDLEKSLDNRDSKTDKKGAVVATNQDLSSSAEKARAKPSPDGEQDELQVPFQKHDHAKYVSVIRNKAIDKLNQEKDCDFARVCRDSYTDEWSLNLYYKQKQSFHYVTYVWDEIDGMWQESFTSEKRPLSRWKHHMTFSSAGKVCRVIKGTQEP